MASKQQSWFRRLFRFRVFLIINLALILLLGVSLGREFLHNYEIEQEINRLEQQAQELEEKHLQFKDLHAAFQTESFVEREARLKLGLKKPGEEVVVITDEQSTPAKPQVGEEGPQGQQIEEGDNDEEISNPMKWWYYFFEQSRFEEIKQQRGA